MIPYLWESKLAVNDSFLLTQTGQPGFFSSYANRAISFGFPSGSFRTTVVTPFFSAI